MDINEYNTDLNYSLCCHQSCCNRNFITPFDQSLLINGIKPFTIYFKRCNSLENLFVMPLCILHTVACIKLCQDLILELGQKFVHP